ncbi:gamma-glutamylcyclotransferase [Ruegeria sediminis]|uniref:Gamma-glutamylcyclotransferase n=1 Tax=Ruegeria sediminis TaxID=2583820 RepID=A0ABY2X448_9RHOB|nr:gamma-glutamylcyclotransferase family protein [Ruegeria sediminis]TMV10143.1 gamma-glutamylcyclotransferase [Ruegeria sediminis]
MADPYFFGYGSLVNLATHDFPDPRPASLKGWRRAWRHTDLRPVAFLTAIPDPDSEIEGMIAHVPKNDWAALDEREWAYDRIPATHAVTHPLTHEVEIAVYAVPEHRHNNPTNSFPILLSYIDVVIQGYLRAFGTDGVDRFFATTDGWDAPILNDRAEPRYPRYQQLRPEETALVDERLAGIAARIIETA